MAPKRQFLLVALVAVVAFLAAASGVWVGRALTDKPEHSQFELHAKLYDELQLQPDQRAELASVESAFNLRRKLLEKQMREANERLAIAIQLEHGYGPQVTDAIDETHRLMGDLQKETLQYLFAMRDVLDEKQAGQFDKIVVDALTADAQ